MSETLNITTPDGDVPAYVARPAVAPAPAVVVIQEIFDVNGDLPEVCDNLAAQGYLAICPDLFWRIARGFDLSDRSEAEWKRGLAIYHGFDLEAAVSDIAATVSVARTIAGASGKVGVVGYCRGRLMAFLAAASRCADAAVSYYGGGSHKVVCGAGKIAPPLLMHLAEADEFVSAQTQRGMVAALKDHPQVEIHTYPGCCHAFARTGGKNYDAVAGEKAHARTLAFFDATLR
jgi:carboxymethylenebutenolidase